MAILSTPLGGAGRVIAPPVTIALRERGRFAAGVRKLQVFADVFAADFGIGSPPAPPAGVKTLAKDRNEIIGPTRKTALLLRQSGPLSMKMRVALAALPLLLAGPAAEASERLFGFEMEKTFSGFTFDGIYDDGAFFSETYFEDGSIRYHDVKGADSGQWSIEGDTFCTFYEGAQGACFVVERDGENCFTFYEAIEGEGGAPKASENWTSRAWNRESESTCATPPGAEI